MREPLQASLELDAAEISSGGGLSYSVVNGGSAPLLVDSACGIEWATDCGWVTLPVSFPPSAVTVLEPTGRSEPQQCVTAGHLLSGHYRLTKQVIDASEPRTGSLLIRQEFSVRRPAARTRRRGAH